MSYKLDSSDENPLWRQYVDELEKMNLNDQEKWLKIIDLPIDLPFKTTTRSIYSEDEFLELLKTDKEFNKRFSKINS